MTHPGLVEAMADPRFYPHRPDRVELVQTHISYIFIAGDLVFKVKRQWTSGSSTSRLSKRGDTTAGKSCG